MNLNNIKVVIVEDEVIIAESIKLYLVQMGCKEIKMAHDIQSAEQLILAWQPSIVLLDIHLEKDDDGIVLGAKLNELKIPFMFITANTDNTTTQRILETYPTGFISKPVRPNEFKINLHMLVRQYEKNGKRLITISNGSDHIQFHETQLNYLMSVGNYIEVHLEERRYIIRNTLEKCLQEMNSDIFVRIHRSYVVSIDKVTNLSANSVEISNEELPISRTYQSHFKLALKSRVL
jgi:DNA-binding LytR/AlgR family response regulator